MSIYKAIINPFTGQLQLVPSSIFHVKDSVSTYTALPLTGNNEHDLRVTEDTDQLYVWSIFTSSGLLTDWKLIGSTSAVDWSAITNKPLSPVGNIDDAVTKRHTQGTDQGLDTGGPNATTASQVKSAVTNSHAPHSDDQDLSGKADKVIGTGLNGHIAELDSNGNLKDSGKSVSGIPNIIRGTFINSDLAGGMLSITHSLNLSAPYSVFVAIFDSTNNQILPDAVIGFANSVNIDLSSFGALSGTYGYLIFA